MSRRTRNRKEIAEVAREAASSDTLTAATQAKRRVWVTAAGMILYFAALIIFGWLSQFYSQFVREPDELYHFHHALTYRLYSPLTSTFPWVTFSVISRYNADLWYGYHMLLIPFTLGNPITGLKTGAIVLTTISAAMVWLAIRWRGAPLSLLWPTLFLFATGFGLSRFYTLRPGVVSMALLALLLSALFAERKRYTFIISALFSFVHLTVIWLPLMVCAVAMATSRLLDGRWRGRAALFTCAGLAVGALVRPNPIGAFHLLYVQTVLLASAKMSGAVPFDAQEMLPLGALGARVVGPFATLIVAATIWLYATQLHRRDMRSALSGAGGYLAATGLLTLAFGLGSVFAALRCLDQFHTFGTLYLAGIATLQLRGAASPSIAGRLAGRSPLAAPAAAACIAVTFVMLGAMNAFRGDPTEDCDPYKFHDADSWLRAHAPAGSVVFHARWSDFPQLWFWNDRDRYIAGMDPIFSYAVNPGKFREYDQFRRDQIGGHRNTLVADPLSAMAHDFGARYAIVEPKSEPILAGTLRGDARARLGFDQDGIQIYEIEALQ